MTGKELWGSILQKAMEGKLVPQRKEEGTAAELLKEIRKEKAKLVKEGKLKKTKPLPAVSEEEKPFDIPDSWEWVRLGDIMLKITDGTHHSPPSFQNGDYMYVTAKNIKDSGIDTKNITYVDKTTHDSIYARCNPEKGDILLIKDGATTGVVAINNLDVPFSLLSSVALLKQASCIFAPFILYMLRSNLLYKNMRSEMKGTGITRITLKQIAPIVLPLPPLPEQHRIVEKLETLKPLVDAYGQAVEELDELNRKFPGDLKKSLLQQAMEGKLVPQRKEEGTAAELLKEIRKEKAKLVKEGKLKKTKPLPSVSEEEKPFDIPDSWEWVRLGDIISIASGVGLPARNMVKGNIPVFGGNGITGHHNQANVLKKTIVIGRVGYYCGSVHITPNQAWVTDNAFITQYIEKCIDEKYLVMTLRFMNLGRSNNATAQPVVSGKKIYPRLFPLPPLPEQHRIAKKLESLLALCDKLQPED